MIKQIGKIGKININANKILKEKFLELGIVRCEITGRDWCLNFCHKSKRIEYRSCPEKLSDINEVLLLTQPIHNLIENDRKLTSDLFKCLRPIGSENGRNKARQLIIKYLEKIGKNYLIDNIL